MKNNKEKFIDKVITEFQYNKGKSSFYCFNKDIIPIIIENVVYNFRKKNGNDTPIFVVVDTYNTRQSIIYHFKNKEINREYIQFLSSDYVKLNYHYPYKLIITVGINDNYDLLKHLYDESIFMMSILTKNIMNIEFITNVRTILPNIETAEFDNKINLDNIYSPVEEHRVCVGLSNTDKLNYDKYTNYINTSIAIFGDLNNIEKCKYGDIKLNISSTEYRNIIAKENGWREDLDTTVPFIKEIDDLYNPNILYERACNFYTISKQRRDLVSDNEYKLDKILEIINNNNDKKILIISKRGEFANKITKYLIKNGIKCGDYHDNIDDCIATNEYGEVILTKSGINKGKPKIIGSQAQSTLNEKRFNNNLINVLSIKNSSNNKLKIACDMIIFTTSLCNNIFDVKKRFINIKFNTNPIIIYKIYTYGTIETEKLNNSSYNNLINVIDETENFIDLGKNSSCIIL